ncbi:Meprin A subunit beta [Desmophyllum pertusum]|uniref:Metalloendopeptidase n=1 Tax=Desmophyllum pertusum TaxID=174260 RepID=A0A9W9ZQF8_9CNID|nr:Meprin A subunit beta [Desmophyllum pertusum]
MAHGVLGSTGANILLGDIIADGETLRTTQKNYVKFTVGNGCSSSVGRTARGEQTVNLHRYCWYKGIVIHELLHAIGFFHEQSRTDRDSYVKVMYENIERGKESNFDKFGQGQIQHLGEPYDYGSIMHYGPDSFSKPVPPGPDENSVVYCSFDSGSLCEFYQGTGDDFDWTIHQGQTASGGTGPNADMSGTGWYIYAETSRPRVQGNRAVLMSPRLTGPYCLRMHYHMLGTSMGSLKVHKRSGSSSSVIEFEAIRGSSYRSDIALDEIKLTPGNCKDPTAITAAPPVTTPTTVKPTTTPKPPSRREGETCSLYDDVILKSK